MVIAVFWYLRHESQTVFKLLNYINSIEYDFSSLVYVQSNNQSYRRHVSYLLINKNLVLRESVCSSRRLGMNHAKGICHGHPFGADGERSRL